MDLVVDANILFAVLVKEGITEELLFKNDFRLFAPEFIFEEFEKYRKLLEKKTKRTESDFNLLLEILQKRITLIPNEELRPFIEKSKRISPDIKDVAYIALALKLNCAV